MRAARQADRGCVLAALTTAAALACTALTSCGNTAAVKDASPDASPPGHPAAQKPAVMIVCPHAGQVDRLTMSRVNSFPQNHEQFTFATQLTVTGAQQARAVARALCALPPMPAGTFHCPVDLGINYQLIFDAGDSKLAPVDIDATGCEQVHGLGTVRWIARSPAFWRVLAAAAGIAPADHATFVGTSQS
jgi:hypothetical protein